jgi:hypothetical protein
MTNDDIEIEIDAPPPSARPTSIIDANDDEENDDVFDSSLFESGLSRLSLNSVNAAARPTAPASASTFERRYTLRNKLQCGSYGTVYVGYHNLRGREYAIKVVDRR